MKKILIIIISIILICLIGLGIIGYNVEKDKLSENNEIKDNEKVEQIVEEKLILDINKFNIDKIEGYTPGEDSQEDNKEYISVGGISLPYIISNKNMEIVSIGGYNGKFTEDGSDIEKNNILSIIVKNTSEEVIDYGEITMKIKGKIGSLKFEFTNLKAGACALVMESTGNVEFNPEDQYTYISSKSEMISDMTLMDSKLSIITENKKITVKNLTDENLDTVYVYYKTISPGNCYLGGTTYRAKFEKVEGGKSVSVNTIHFNSSNSEILKVESIKE